MALSAQVQELVSSAVKGAQGSVHHVWSTLGALAGIYLLSKIVRFCRADADMRLLSKRAPPKNAFEDKVVWITGASQGLGEQLALQFSEAGAYVVLSSRSRAKLEKVKDKCGGKHGKEAIILPLDLTDSVDKLEEAATSALEAFGSSVCGVHYMVHNAGASQRCPVEEASVESVDNLYELNVSGTLRLTRVILPRLLEQAEAGEPAKFVVIGSLVSQVPAPGQAVYAACKTSIAAYFRTLHSELWSRGVTVSLCHPGPMASSEGQQRFLYGPNGPMTVSESGTAKGSRQNAQRAASLILRAVYHSVDSCWIGQHPILLTAYLVQYWPRLGYWIINKVGPGRVRSYKEGGSGYDYQNLAKSK